MSTFTSQIGPKALSQPTFNRVSELYTTKHQNEIAASIDPCSKINKSQMHTHLAKIVAEYVVDANQIWFEAPKLWFGAAEWRAYFGVDVGPEPKRPPTDWFKNSPDPINPQKKICDTHYPPVLRPRWVTKISSNTLHNFNLHTLEELIKDSAHDKRPKCYVNESEAMFQHGRAKGNPACWIVMRKDGVLAQNQMYNQQTKFVENLNKTTEANYEINPSVIDLATVCAVRNLLTGDFPFGNCGGLRGYRTYSRCKEIVKIQKNEFPVILGNYTEEGLHIYDYDGYNHPGIGIAGVRKF